MKKATYVLTRCKAKTGHDRQKMTHYGTEHETLCGKVVDDMWWIEESGMPVTCPKCKAKMGAQNVDIGIPHPELKPGCPPAFQGVTESEMAEMTPEQREFLRAWG